MEKELVKKSVVQREKGYFYYVDRKGDMYRRKWIHNKKVVAKIDKTD